MPEPEFQKQLQAHDIKAFGLWEGRFVHITILKLKKEYLWNNSRKKETEVGTGFFGTLSSFFVHVFDLQPSGTAFICGLRPQIKAVPSGIRSKKCPKKLDSVPKKPVPTSVSFF